MIMSVKKKWLRYIQYGITLCLMIGLVSQVDLSLVIPLFRLVQWDKISFCLALILLSHFINVVRWQSLQNSDQIDFADLLKFYAAGLFASNFLPTGIGGDGLRVILLGRRTKFADALVTVLLDRILGLLVLVGFLGVALVAKLPLPFNIVIPEWIKPWGIVFSIIAILSGIILTFRPDFRGWVLQKLEPIHSAKWDLATWLRRLTIGIALSVVAQLCLFGAVWLNLFAFNLHLPMSVPIWLVIFSSFSLFLPVTFNGIGMVEGVYVAILASYNVPTTTGLSVALLLRFLSTTLSLLGGLALLTFEYPKQTVS